MYIIVMVIMAGVHIRPKRFLPKGVIYVGRKKSRKKKAYTEPVSSAGSLHKDPLVHNPFDSLKGLEPAVEKPEPVQEEPVAIEPEIPVWDDETAFQAAMAGVTPMQWRKPTIGTPKKQRDPMPRRDSDDLEVLAHLEDLVAGRIQFDLVNTDEYLEGYIRGIHPVILEKLRGGHFSVQAYLDLHGLTVREAEEAVEEFISESSALRYRCVLLVHGRGLNSKDQIPVLKKRLETILLRGPVKKKILAFTSARPHDGGAGASYVLLRAKSR